MTDTARPAGFDRRSFLRRSAAVAGATAAASVPFQALAQRTAGAAPVERAAGYGPLAPVRDHATGLELLALPRGFEYISYGWTGDQMSDGAPTPSAHDGMAAFRYGERVHIVRNHERGYGSAFTNPGVRRCGGRGHHHPHVRPERGRVAGLGAQPRRHHPQLRRRTDAVGDLAVLRRGLLGRAGIRHGYVFEVPPTARRARRSR